jgi:hypothetical protein
MSFITTLSLFLVLAVAGSCSCTQTAHLFAPAQEPLAQVPPRWQRTDLGRFSLSLPPDMKKVDVKGIDSSVWEFKNSGTTLAIDLGSYYSEDLSTYKDWPDFHEEEVKIDSRTGKLCTFRHSPDFMDSADGDRVYIATLGFSDIGFGKNGLTFWIASNTVEGQQTAKTIFNSIKFK